MSTKCCELVTYACGQTVKPEYVEKNSREKGLAQFWLHTKKHQKAEFLMFFLNLRGLELRSLSFHKSQNTGKCLVISLW